jgi:hypothetical protein
MVGRSLTPAIPTLVSLDTVATVFGMEFAATVSVTRGSACIIAIIIR